jgi:MFS family permease
MTGFSTYPALLAPLREAWGMSGAEAGFIGGVFFAGYMGAVPLLSALTDRIDARRVYFLSTLLSAGRHARLRPVRRTACGAPACSRRWPGPGWPAPTCRA